MAERVSASSGILVALFLVPIISIVAGLRSIGRARGFDYLLETCGQCTAMSTSTTLSWPSAGAKRD